MLKYDINEGFEIKEEKVLKEITTEFNYFKIIERTYVNNTKKYYIRDYLGTIWRKSNTLKGLYRKIEEDKEFTFA